MDFFEEQERARRRSRWLVLWYLAAAAAVVASYCAVAAGLYALLALYWGASVQPPRELLAGVALLVGGGILAVSAWRIWQLRDGGAAVAYLLGARYVEPGNCSPAERRLLNVIEEMAIASGVAVPPVYCLQREEAINALVAGYSPNEAVIIVTRGALARLSRDELQGVMGHEFSHILNGDMALNVRLVGLLAGLEWPVDAGENMVFQVGKEFRSKEREERGGEALLAVLGALVAFIGFPGALAADAIKAAISRERELLADAASVQFTRNPEAIAGALDSILALRAHTAVSALHCELFSHMFFAQALGRWWGFPTHPSLETRIRRAHPRFLRDDYRERRHGKRQHVAVIDGGGNVVKHVKALSFISSIGHPGAQHVDHAAKLLASLPERLRLALRRPGEAGPRPRAPRSCTHMSASSRATTCSRSPTWRCRRSRSRGRRRATPSSPTSPRSWRRTGASRCASSCCSRCCASACARGRASRSPRGSAASRRWPPTRGTSCPWWRSPAATTPRHSRGALRCSSWAGRKSFQ